MLDVFKSLNTEQQKAVSEVAGPSVVLAGAGSGKTRVLIHKVLNLILNHHIPSSAIVMITFTNKAAREMKERIEKATENKVALGYVGTFHSFCCMVLRRSGEHIGLPRTFSIYDTNDQQDVIKSILKKIDGQKYSPSYFLNRISDAKNQLIPPQRYLEIFSFYRAATVAEIYMEYQKILKKNNAVDFDDLIMRVGELFQKHPEILAAYQQRYSHFLVDEFQDTNIAQYALVKMLSQRDKNVTVVGDFSQSIYSWRGADIRNLEKFSVDFPNAKIFKLEQNYRSTQNILNMAYEVISVNQTHPILQLYTQNQQGDEIEYHQAEHEEAEAIYISDQIQQLVNTADYTDVAVLFRTNAQSRIIEETFLHYGIPYVLIGGVRFYERKEIKDLLSYLRLLIHPTDLVSTERIKKLGKKRWESFKKLYEHIQDHVLTMPTVEILERIFTDVGYLSLYDPDIPEDYARLENIKELKSVAINIPHLVDFLEQVALVESEYFAGEKKGEKTGVRLMTMHQAKGLEFDYVFIAGVEEGILPHARSIDDLNQLEEERRLFYVGITRARQKLFITYTKRRFIFGRRNAAIKSRFIRQEDEIVAEDWNYF